MSDLHLTPDFEAALRRGLSDLAASAPVPDDAHLDGLERRTAGAPSRTERGGRPLALVAAIVLVLAGLIGALAVRDRDPRTGFDKVGGEVTTSTAAATTTTPFGPVLPARLLIVADAAPPLAGVPEPTVVNSASDAATLAEIWSDAGLPPADRPTIDFAEEVVLEVVVEDIGCPSPTLEFQKGVAAVRAHVVEPSSCADPLTEPTSRTYFYALRWADTGRPFGFDLLDQSDPDAFGSIPVD